MSRSAPRAVSGCGTPIPSSRSDVIAPATGRPRRPSSTVRSALNEVRPPVPKFFQPDKLPSE